MTARPARYIPALRFDWLKPLYDPVLRWVMREERFKGILVAQVGLQAEQRALDLGCEGPRRPERGQAVRRVPVDP